VATARDLRRRWARRWLPWLAAAGLFAWLLARVPVGALRDALRDSLRQGAWLPVVVWALIATVAVLPLDAFATREALAIAGLSRGCREILLVRGASYLLGLVSYVAGQGGVGIWLAKSGARAARAAGAMLFLMVSNGIALVLLAALGLLADLPGERRGLLLWLTAGAIAGIALYLAVIASRVRWLAGRAALAPLFAAGLAGHLRAAAARLPHLVVMAGLQWAAFRAWGLAVPFWRGLALMLVVLLVGALPVTPSGLGTSQVLQVLLFSPWSPATTAAARGADVLALSLVYSVSGLLWQAAVGVVCLAVLRRDGRGDDGDSASGAVAEGP